MAATVILVGADKGGVGKTMVARALLDDLTRRNVKFRAFDCESPGGDLNRFAADASVIDIGSIQDQMKVFDDAGTDAITVVDLRAGLLSPTLRALDEAKLLDEVRAGNMALVLLHVLGPTVASVGEITAAAEMIGGGSRHLLVKNHINASQFFEWDQGDAKAVFDRMADVTINVPQLHVDICEALQKRGSSFLSFVSDGKSRLQRGLLRTWLDKVWGEFDRVKVLG